MKAHENDILVDKDGSVWAYDWHNEGWRYLTQSDDGEVSLSFDKFNELPNSWGPFTTLDPAATSAVRTYLGMLRV